MDPIIFAIAVGLGVPFYLLYYRKKKWFIASRIYMLNSAIGLIGLCLGLYFKTNEFYFLTWCFSCPIIIFSIDRVFKNYSEKTQGRDFILWLRYSDEIDWTTGGENSHVRASDKVISISILFILVGLLGFGAAIFAK